MYYVQQWTSIIRQTNNKKRFYNFIYKKKRVIMKALSLCKILHTFIYDLQFKRHKRHKNTIRTYNSVPKYKRVLLESIYFLNRFLYDHII